MQPKDKPASHLENQRTAVEQPPSMLTGLLRMHLDICDDLEQVADSLPNQLDPGKCRQLAHLLQTVILPVHELEERVVFPLIVARTSSSGINERTLERLRSEHGTDRGYASEVAEFLHELSNRACCIGMNAVGYALRGLFESMRRHVHFDLEQIVPAVGSSLTPADLQRMSEILQSRQLIVAQHGAQFPENLTIPPAH